MSNNLFGLSGLLTVTTFLVMYIINIEQTFLVSEANFKYEQQINAINITQEKDKIICQLQKEISELISELNDKIAENNINKIQIEVLERELNENKLDTAEFHAQKNELFDLKSQLIDLYLLDFHWFGRKGIEVCVKIQDSDISIISKTNNQETLKFIRNLKSSLQKKVQILNLKRFTFNVVS